MKQWHALICIKLYASFWSISLQKDRAEMAKNKINLKLGDGKLFKDFDMERVLKNMRAKSFREMINREQDKRLFMK